jgi:hypothetical protein
VSETSPEIRTLKAVGTRIPVAIGSLAPAAKAYPPQIIVKDLSSFWLYAFNTHTGGTSYPYSIELDATIDGSNWTNLGSVDKLAGTLPPGTIIPSAPVTSPYYAVRVGIWASEGTAKAGTANMYLMGRR